MFRRIKKEFEHRKISSTSLTRLFGLISPFRTEIILLVLLRSLIALAGVASALINKRIVDYAQSQLEIVWVVLLAVALSAFTLVGSSLLGLFSVRVTERLSCKLRRKLYADIIGSTRAERCGQHSAGFLSRLTSDVNTVADAAVSVSSAFAAALIQLVLAFILLWHFDSFLAFLALMSTPLLVFFSFFMGRKLKKIQQKLQQSEADYRIYLQEQLSNSDVVKAFEYETESLAGLDRLQEQRMKLVIRKNRCNLLLRLGINAVFSFSYLFAFVSGALQVAAGTVTFGTMTAFLSLVNQIQSPVLSLSKVFSRFIAMLASGSRIMDIAVMQHEKTAEAQAAAKAPEYIRAEKVSFSYEVGKPVLSDLSFEAKIGSITAVTGASGAGKTTLIRLLLGFLTPDKGGIYFVDCENKAQPVNSSTRSLISYVPQGNTLFSATIAENLRIGNSSATDAEIERAIRLACADFVYDLPEKTDTVIGEKAYGISEGQAQRLAIARALLRNAPIVIFDEATSSLDESTERKILDNIASEKDGRTYIIISHRPAATDYADSIIRL